MGNQPDSEDNAPLANRAQEDVPVEAEVEPIATSELILSTRTSRAWIRLLPALVVLVVILVFVFQNPKDVKVSLFTFSGTLPLSVALLGAVVLGALMTLALGSLRILQLRRQVQRKLERSEGDNRRHR
ncbi:MAG: LapA family protein [Acidimicrobiales bacterium]